MPKANLTVKAIERIKPPAAGQVDYFAQGYPGLALRVSAGGTRTWTYFYRWRGQQKRLSLGELKLADAHQAWRDARDLLAKGREPGVKTTVANPENFETVAEAWIAADQADNRSGESVRYVRQHAISAWGQLRIGDITKAQVRLLINGIASKGKVVSARRCHSALHRLFKWAASEDIIAVSPMVDLLKPGEEKARDRALNNFELALLWHAATDLGYPMGTAVQMLIATAARRDEIGELRHAEIRWDKREIYLRGSEGRTKNDSDFMIPLSAIALRLLKKAPKIAHSKHVFTTTGKTPVSGWANAKEAIDRRMLKTAQALAEKRGESPDEFEIEPWRFHDIRRTVAKSMQRKGVPLPVTEALLGHTSGSKAGVVKIYQVYEYERERRAALDKWAKRIAAVERLAGIIGGAR
jgi:integrase